MKLLTIFSVLVPVATVGAEVFKAPSGPYKVQWDSFELVDHSRVDPFNASHPRRLMVSQFTPVKPSRCRKTCRVPYLPKDIAELEDGIIDDYLGNAGWPTGVLSTLELELCCRAHRREEKTSQTARRNKEDKWPTIVFGTGLNTTRLFYSATAQHLASIGYEILVLDHPYETDIVQFPNGDIVIGGHIGRDPEDVPDLVKGLSVRAADTSFVLDELCVDSTAFIGQSYGGAAAAHALTTGDQRLVAGANLDGALWGPLAQQGVSRPFLIWGSTGHNSTSEASWGDFWKAMDKNHKKVWTRELSLEESVHNSMTDFALVGDITGLREAGSKPIKEFFGEVTGQRVMKVLKAYLGDFIEFALHDAGQGLLKGPSDRFQDVEFLRKTG